MTVVLPVVLPAVVAGARYRASSATEIRETSTSRILIGIRFRSTCGSHSSCYSSSLKNLHPLRFGESRRTTQNNRIVARFETIVRQQQGVAQLRVRLKQLQHRSECKLREEAENRVTLTVTAGCCSSAEHARTQGAKPTKPFVENDMEAGFKNLQYGRI